MTTHACTDEPCVICAAEEAEELEAERIREEQKARVTRALERFEQKQRDEAAKRRERGRR